MSTAFIKAEPIISLAPPSECTTEALVEITVGVFHKLRPFLPYLQELRKRFAAAPRGRADIDGCNTWEDFCDKRLQRTPDAVRKLFQSVNETNGGKPCKCPDCPETFQSISDGLRHGKKAHGVCSDQIAEFKRLLLGREKPAPPAPTPTPAPTRVHSRSRVEPAEENTTARPRRATEQPDYPNVLTESFYVIRRKSDGKYANHRSGFSAEIHEGRVFNEADVYRGLNRHKSDRFKWLKNDDWDWVRVEAKYTLGKLPYLEACPQCMVIAITDRSHEIVRVPYADMPAHYRQDHPDNVKDLCLQGEEK